MLDWDFVELGSLDASTFRLFGTIANGSMIPPSASTFSIKAFTQALMTVGSSSPVMSHASFNRACNSSGSLMVMRESFAMQRGDTFSRIGRQRNL